LVGANLLLNAGTGAFIASHIQFCSISDSRRRSEAERLVVSVESVARGFATDHPVWRGDPPPQKWLHICRDGILAAPRSLEWAFWQIGTEVERSTTEPAA
jgi:hypothetical protein